MITKKLFETLSIGDVYSYTLTNANGMEVEILNLGGIIRKIVFNGVDVVLARECYEKYICGSNYFGALIGRNSNRIECSKFELNGNTYELAKNDGNNNLHGGVYGFNARLWNVEIVDEDAPKLVLTLFSADGEEGYPGNVNVKVTYTLTNENSVIIHYEGLADSDTILNMTNHSYFNLNGHASGDILNHTLKLDCDFYTPVNDEVIPNGEILSVKGTPFDFTEGKLVGQDINAEDEQLANAGGYDHNFVINGSGFRWCATLIGDKTNIEMKVYTDLPAIQLYSGNFLDKESDCKDGAVYDYRNAVCLETQVFPNFTKYAFFPGGFLKKGEKYDTTTEFKFNQN